jgi:hypothetical protein
MHAVLVLHSDLLLGSIMYIRLCWMLSKMACTGNAFGSCINMLATQHQIHALCIELPILQMPNPIASRPQSGRAGGHTGAGEPGAGGLRVAWKHDVYDSTLSPEQSAGKAYVWGSTTSARACESSQNGLLCAALV